MPMEQNLKIEALSTFKLHNTSQQKSAYFFALISVLLWSTVATAFKIGLEYLSYIESLFFSTISSTIILMIFYIIKHNSLSIELNPKNLLFSAFAGLLNPFLYYMALFKAYYLLPAQEALTLNYTWAIMVVIMSIIFLKQKIRLTSLSALGISFLGVIVIATQGNITALEFRNNEGVFLALGSSVLWALYWVLNIKDKREIIPKLLMNFIFGSIYIILYILLTDTKLNFRTEGIVASFYIGAFEMGITFLLWLKALTLSENTAKVSNLIFLSPFISLFIINLVLGENILPSTIIGLVFVVIGILIQNRINKAE